MQTNIFSSLFYGTVVILGVYIVISSRNDNVNDFILLPLIVLSIVFFFIQAYLKKKKK